MIQIALDRIFTCVLTAVIFAAMFTEAQAADLPRIVTKVLESMRDASYIGGMSPEVRQLAIDAREDMQRVLGKALPVCERPDPRKGLIVSTGVGVKPPVSQSQMSPLLAELQVLLRSKRPFVRDAAAYVVAEIGPAANSLKPDLSGKDFDRSPWFTHALARISCESYAPSDGLDLVPAAARSRLIGTASEWLSLRMRVRLTAELLEDKRLHWPEGFFASFISGAESPEDGRVREQVEPSAVRKIVDRVMDESLSRSFRVELIELLENIGRDASPYSERLRLLANGSDDELAFSSAHALMTIGDADAVPAAGILLERFDVELSLLPMALCSAPDVRDVLGPQVKQRFKGENWVEAAEAAKWLGCLDPMGNAETLRSSLHHPSWETQIAVIAALSASAQSDPDIQQALREVQRTHWSGLVRMKAAESLDPPPPEERNGEDLSLVFNCFHRCLTDHLRRCGDDEGIVDGIYVSRSMGQLDIEWERVRRVPMPEGFPVKVSEDGRPEYGTSTYLRVKDGWLYGTDRWHYGGEIAFVDDQGHVSNLGNWGEDVAAFVDTPHFGLTLLGGSLFDVGNAGLLAQVKGVGHERKLVPRVALPSPPWGWAFAPNGTLLVADPYEAVAVLEDGSIESLDCPVRKPDSPPRSLLAMAKKSHPRLSVRAQSDANDAVKLHEATFSAQRARIEDLARDLSSREVWESQENLRTSVNGALDEWLRAYLEAARAGDALRTLELLTASNAAAASPSIRFVVYASAGQAEQARMQLTGALATDDFEALLMLAMLDIAEGRADAAKATLGRVEKLAEKSSAQRDDVYLQLLRGLITKRWPEASPSKDGTNAWPRPIREFLSGRSDESTLVMASYARDGRVDREKLCEALFFNGLKLASEGKPRRARAQFRAAAALQVQHFREHAVAMTVLKGRM